MKAKTTKKKPAKKQVKPPQRRGQGKQASVAAAYATSNLGKSPVIRATRDSCRIKHREFISNVIGASAFTIGGTFPINPGMSSTFPWLSLQAQCWEQYEFKSLRFCYFTRTGSTQTGSLIMAVDYDAADGAPLSEAVMTAYDGAVEDVPWKDMHCVVKPALMRGPMKRHYVRTRALDPNQDIKTYDVGNFYFAQVDGVVNQAWGKLWVEYDIELSIPQLPPSGQADIPAGVSGSGGTLSSANPLGTAPNFSVNNNGVDFDTTSKVTYAEPGTYLAEFAVNGTALTDQTLTNVANTAVTVINKIVTAASTLGTYRVVTSQPNAVLQLASVGTTPSLAGFQTSMIPPNLF